VKSKTSEVNPEESTFTTAIEELEKLLHSETQAIVASDVEKLETILSRKEIALQNVLTEQADLGYDPRQNPFLSKLLDRILQIQQRNKHTLDNLVDTNKKDAPENGNGLRVRKIRSAYLSHYEKKDGRMLDV
jgi:hypothetical protein